MDFGHLLIQRGLITAGQLEEVLGIQRRYILEGKEPVPRLGEILLERGWVSEKQVADVLAAQNKKILWCSNCQTKVNVEDRADAASYKCGRCQREMTPPPEEMSDIRVVDTSVILVAKDPVPAEVQAASEEPARRLGKYILLEEMGRGGWAIVHRAWDTYLHQYVALKFLKPTRPSEDEKRKHEARIHDLLKEARSAIRLRHPHIVTVYDVGRIDKLFYIAMDCLNGKTLGQHMKDSKERGKVSPLYEDPQKYVTIMRDISRALHYAHTRQIPVIHCDLKPSNIFIDSATGKASILDFGLSRELLKDQVKSETVIRGTPSYMAPEQASGKTELIDARTDVYGLGAILYELLTGRPPFVGELFEVLTKATSTVPIKPSQALADNPIVRSSGFGPVAVPPALERICLNCLEKSKEARYPTALEVAEELDSVLGSQDLRGESRPETVMELSTDILKRREEKHRKKTERFHQAKEKEGRLFFASSVIISVVAVVVAVLSWTSRPKNSLESVQGQLETLRKKLDTQTASFQIEAAQKGFSEVAAIDDGSFPRQWIERQMEGLEWIRRMKGRLIEAINGKVQYKAATFKLKDRQLLQVEVVHAFDDRIVAISAGETRDIQWAVIDPNQLSEMIKAVLGMANPSDRLALAIYCMKTALNKEAEELLNSLVGTDLEIPSQTYIRDLAPK